MKFSPQQLPLGTIVEIDESICWTPEEKASPYRVVRGISKNGVNSYVIKTGLSKGRSGAEYINLAYITRIVERGTEGPATIEYGWYGLQPFTQKMVKDVEIMRLYRTGVEYKKNTRYQSKYHYTGSSNTFIYTEVAKIGKPGMQVDFQRMIRDLGMQTWVKKERWFWTAYDKKRLRKWLKANLNRYLFSLKALQRQEDKEMQEDADAAWEADLRLAEKELGFFEEPSANEADVYREGDDTYSPFALDSADDPRYD